MTINFDNIITSADDVYKVLSELDIYEKYLGSSIQTTKLYKCICPNHKDNHPSLGFYQSGNNHIRYKCFGCGRAGGAIDFVKDYYLCDYNEAIKKISKDFGLDNNVIDKSQFKRKSIISESNVRSQILPTFRNFKKIDYDYWNSFTIPLERCLKYKVNPCQRVYYINKLQEYKLWAEHSDINPIYNYTVNSKFKCYRPLAEKKSKWLSTTGLYDIQGLEQLPERGELLVLTSSLKDVMVLDGFGYNSIALGGEGNFLPDKILDFLYASFQEIMVFYDNDEPGLNYGEKISEKIGCKYTYIPTELNDTKDISDFVKKYGVDETSSLLNSII